MGVSGIQRCDVAVLGGGPAGCVLAMRLSALGYRVMVLTVPRRDSLEGFSARTLDALARAGCMAALGTVGPAVARHATWGGRTAAPNTEHVVQRAAFDAALLKDAACGGVEVARARVRDVTQHRDGWVVVGETADGRRLRCGAAFVVEARGRAAPVRAARRGPATLCLSRLFRCGPGAAGRSALSACASGWAWYAVDPHGRGVLQLCVDPPHDRVVRRSGLVEFYTAQVGSVPAARRWLANVEPIGDVTAAEASPRLASRLAGEGFLRVGDAAAAIDPLSGQGVFEAVASALLAAPVVNTLLRAPRDGRLAVAFYRDRVCATFRRLCRTGRAFYACERRWPAKPFWVARRAWPDEEPHLAAAPCRTFIAPRAVVMDDRVVRRSVLITPAYPDGIYQVHGVPIVPLVRLLGSASADGSRVRVGEAASRLQRAPAAIQAAVAWLRAHARGIDGPVRASSSASEFV
jgi:flavin-dependent dehydrogenase